jgi:hypothetical protein
MEVKNEMPKVSDLDDYLHAEAVKEGDVIKIDGKARLISAEESNFSKPYFEIPILTPDGEHKTWTPNKTTLKALAKVYGDDTDLWQGKLVKLSKARMNIRGEMKDVLFGEAFAEPKAEQQVNLQ